MSKPGNGEIAVEHRIEGTKDFNPADLEIVKELRDSFMERYPLLIDPDKKRSIGINDYLKREFSQQDITELVMNAREKQIHNNGRKG